MQSSDPLPPVTVRPFTVRRVPTGGVDLLRNAPELLQQHWDELTEHKALLGLDLDWKKYYLLEEQGMLLVLVAETAQGNRGLIGYSVAFLTQHLHHRSVRVCQSDLLFVDCEWRRMGVGRMLIVGTELTARERGAKLMFWHARPQTALADVMLRSSSPHDLVFSKELV